MSYLPPVLLSCHYANIFSVAHTGIFWDVNDFPLPCLNPRVVDEGIKSTLKLKGYTGSVSVWLYAKDETQIKKEYKEDYESLGFRICFEPKDTRDYRMTVDMLICAVDHGTSNLMVLAKDFKEKDAVYNIYRLHQREQNIFLAYKQQVEPRLDSTENPRWIYESLLKIESGQHINKKRRNIISFNPMPIEPQSPPRSSDHITHAIWDDHITHAIWDAVDSATLQDSKPVFFAANIDAFFIIRDLPPPNFTKVFADEDALPEHLITEYRGSNLLVDILPKGNRRSRIQKIAKFILFHALTHATELATLLVLSEDIQEDPLLKTVFQAVSSRGLKLIFQPPKSVLMSELYLDPQYRGWF
ncbi:hypothetical protein HA466_0099990 [Hirschfeldia incana]|nr:hypothetical protein HA466_0099990 [Hirschfeldia incana]